MTVCFLDSSALVKRYINEVGSAWILNLLAPTANHEIFVAAIAGVEIVAAITRRARGGGIDAADAGTIRSQFKADLQTEYQIVEITKGIIDAGMNLAEKHGLRGYDAIQLAAGCAVNALCIANNVSPLMFISADQELNLAASGEGLIVENPINHP